MPVVICYAAPFGCQNVPQIAYQRCQRGFLEEIIKSGDVRLPKMLKPEER